METRNQKEPSIKTESSRTSKSFEVDNEHFSFTQTVNEITYSTK